MIDSTFEGIVTTVTSQIEQALGLAFHLSKMPLNIKVTTANGDRRDVLGVYAFSHGKGLRFDFDEQTGDLLEIAVWTGPGDLEVPDLRVQGMDQVEMIINALRSETPMMEESSKLLEGARDDVNAYLNTLGVEAENQKIAQLYRGYFEWAGQKGKNPVSNARFRTLANEWFEGGEESQPAPEQKDEIVVSPEEQAEFDDIMQNEVFYTTKLMESSVRRIARSDPGIVSLFICGGPGLGKTFCVKTVLKEEGVWDTEVIYKSGSIAGFTGLRQLLWDYRKGKIIVLDDCDTVLAIPAAANILKAALNSDPEARIVSYVKARGRK